MATRRRLTREYKDQAVSIFLDSGRSITEVATSIGVHEVTLGQSVKKAKDGGRVQDLFEAELERLRKDNVRRENGA